ncbi:MAG TPA: zinc-binding alcohol dehydrogenase family protein [Bacteroidales bacterium]|nr:zinc-binding alcohol dehydrogenase family protein [Bacteroidales bacterium]
MRAVVLYRTCTPEELSVTDVPVPETRSGWVLIRVKAFGLNRSELMLRAYEADSPYIKLPRIPGIECAGEIANPSDSNFLTGQKVIALMGGMGRSFDGSYAEYALVPSRNVFRVETDLGWEELAAIPESYFTAYGSLFDCLQLTSGDSLFVRGGTSALGLSAIQLAKCAGATVVATTRNEEKRELLTSQGTDFVLIDDGTIREQLLKVYPNGVTKILELIGPLTLRESARLASFHGIVCSTGILGKEGVLKYFNPIQDIPNGVYLTGFYSNYPTQAVIDNIFKRIESYRLHPVISNVFPLEEIGQAHRLMEDNRAKGKVVIKL